MGVLRVDIEPSVLDWALRRTGLSDEKLRATFPKVNDWRSGEERPTLNQAKELAKKARIPFGRLLLQAPSGEETDLPDFRTVKNERLDGLSPDLQEVIHSAEGRLGWYSDYAEEVGIPGPEILRSAQDSTSPSLAARQARIALGLDETSPIAGPERVTTLTHHMEDIGILVSRNAIVGNSTQRHLSIDEFRGFTLIDGEYCLVFVNTSDAKTAQLFSLAHELGHVALAKAGISDHSDHLRVGRWCNEFAAAFIAPETAVKERYNKKCSLLDNVTSLASVFGISREAMLLRLKDIFLIEQQEFDEVMRLVRVRKEKKATQEGGGGPSFHVLVRSRVGGRFFETITFAAKSGQIPERDAARLLGAASYKSFENLVKKSDWASREAEYLGSKFQLIGD